MCMCYLTCSSLVQPQSLTTIKCWTALWACGQTFLLMELMSSVSKENTVNKNRPINIEENKST